MIQTQSQADFPLHPAMDMTTTSSTTSPSAASDSIYVRIIAICNKDFHAESRYLACSYFNMSWLMGLSPIILLQASERVFESFALDWAALLGIIFGGGFLFISVMPMCGIIHNLDSPETQRHPFSIIRIFVDHGPGYQRARFVFYFLGPAWCAICLGLVLGLPELAFLMYFAPALYMLIFFFTFLIFLSSVYSKVLLRRK